ncbi:response regulator [Streptomyces sp. enrichment culture]|uniref:response regulator n=1 Tax=Streptomyces sp. enrichment culture TaxID=1795815 RepID=UPI003F5564DF
MTRVLMIDDEPRIVRGLVVHLDARGYEVDLAHDAAEGLRLAAERRPDVVVLDLDMSGTDRGRMLRALRERAGGAQILGVSARRGHEDKTEALAAGADDYVTKPFGPDALLARLRAAVRRAEPGETGGVLVETPAFTLDLGTRRAVREGREIRLTPTEWRLVEVLVRNTGRLVGQKELLQEVWGPSYGTETNYLRVYLAQLRRKLEADPSRPRHFRTEPGAGYRFEK